MIVLTATTDKIQAVLGGAVTANQLQCFSSWRDITTSTYTPGRTLVNTNNTTDVDIVGAPGSSTQRVVDHISIYNPDTAAATVTVKFDANGTEYILEKVQLQTLEKLEYTNDGGWRVITNLGSIKTSINQGQSPISSGYNAVVLASDVVNNNGTANTIADVSGLAFPVSSGATYWFKFVIDYTAQATTTGSRWSISGPTFTRLAYASTYSLTATTFTFNAGVAYDFPVASNATSAATAGNSAYIEGYITPSANGNVIARFASEVASSAITAKKGSTLFWMQVIAV